MATITLQVPDTLADSHQEISRFLAAKLYESGKLTLGQAAELTGMEKWDFAEILIEYGVHFLDPGAAEDLANAEG